MTAREMAQVLGWEERPPATGRRSGFEVRMDILKAVADGFAKPTHIMYRSNTSWIMLQKNLAASVGSGLVRECGEGLRADYAITQKGMAVVRDYAAIMEMATEPPAEVRG